MGHNTEAQIRILLELYFEGATTLEQERMLRDYFSAADDIPADMEYAGAMFGFFSTASHGVSRVDTAFTEAGKAISPDRGVDSTGISGTAIADASNNDCETTFGSNDHDLTMSLTPERMPAATQAGGRLRLPLTRRISRIAVAAVVAAVAVTFALNIGNTEEFAYCYVNGKAITDRDVAIACARDALSLANDNGLNLLTESLTMQEDLRGPLDELNNTLQAFEMLSLFDEETN